jgi:hypothetical protein
MPVQDGPGWLATSEWHVNGPFVAGNCGDRNTDGRDDYVVWGPDNRVRVLSGADDAEIESSAEQLASAREVARRSSFPSGKDPQLATAPAFEPIRRLSDKGRSRVEVFVPVSASGLRWTERIVVNPDSTPHIQWFELAKREPRTALQPRTPCSFDFAFLADVDRDGTEDVVVHSDALFDEWTMRQFEEDAAGLIALSGKTGLELWRTVFSGPTANWEYTLPGWPNLVSPGDLDGDGSPDFALADPKHAFCQDERPSSLLAVSGKSGTILWRQFGDPKFGETLGVSVALVSDRDGDSVRDIVFARGDDSDKHEHILGIVSAKTGVILKRWAP